MACSTNRCALRRFDGHGSSSYRPSNPEAAREFTSRMDQMLAERTRQDQGVFVAPTPPMTAPAHQALSPAKQALSPAKQAQFAQLQTHPVTCYPLSDSGVASRRT